MPIFFMLVDIDALSSYYNQLFVRHLKTELRRVDISPQALNSIAYRVEKNGESLLQISKEYKLGTFKVAKSYLEYVYNNQVQPSTVLSDPEIIKSVELRKDILKLLRDDPVCSYEVDIIKECLGREYENLLIKMLTERHMCFETESELRSRGKPKTPDILFQIPMGLARNEYDKMSPYLNTTSKTTEMEGSGKDYVVINWIDSKAMFADIITFDEHLEQLRAYNNRYGRGLVIYWHGCTEEIYSKLRDDMIIVRDSFPDHWIFPTGELADGNVPMFLS
mmetsp:Transcript_5375/g.7442  ORF Transcript_5375/g.7442 Transcript_5375/m.7442 type:complete len:278 (+) Transcript_5375:72-905(+)